MLLKNKKSQDLLTGTMMFLILNVIFFGVMIILSAWAGSGAAMIEKKEARRIALAIDEMKPGTELSIYLGDIYTAAKKNHFEEASIIIDTSTNTVTVNITAGKGHSYKYFTAVPPGAESARLEGELLKIKI